MSSHLLRACASNVDSHKYYKNDLFITIIDARD